MKTKEAPLHEFKAIVTLKFYAPCSNKKASLQWHRAVIKSKLEDWEAKNVKVKLTSRKI